MGGMSAQIPIKEDAKANEIAMAKVRADKLREVKNGHDGTWIAHPLINKIAMEVFNEHMVGPNQVCILHRPCIFAETDFALQYHLRREDVHVAANDLLNTTVPGKITPGGVRSSVETALAYSAAWVGGNGCIPLNHLMEDAATAEITRVQLWQYVKYHSRMESGEYVTAEYIDRIIEEVIPALKSASVTEKNLRLIGEYLKKQVRQEWPSEFLTSDLMSHLAIADGCPPQFFRSAL